MFPTSLQITIVPERLSQLVGSSNRLLGESVDCKFHRSSGTGAITETGGCFATGNLPGDSRSAATIESE